MNPMREKWGVPPDHVFTREEYALNWNGVLKDYDALVPYVDVQGGRGSIVFPWKTSMSRFYDSTNSPLLWRTDVYLGTLNDAPPTLIYQTSKDPRGWTPPQPLVPPVPFVERSMADYDTPWLLLTTPKPGADPTNADQFVQVADGARPSFFRTAAMLEKNLFQASVFLTSIVSELSEVPPQYRSILKKQFRLRAGRLPVPIVAVDGGQIELARVYLLRDPKEVDGSGDTMLVRQQVFWCLWSMLTVPIDPTGGALDVFGIGDLFTAGAEYDFWSV